MSGLTQEQFDGLPDYIKNDYVLDEASGEYKHGGFLKVKKTANELDNKLKLQASEYSTLSEQLAEIETNKQLELKKVREEALEEALANNKTEEVKSLYQQKIEDAEQRALDAEERVNQRLGDIAGKQKNAIIAELSSLATKSGKAAMERLLPSYIQIDPNTGEETYLNDDGSASSLNKEQFIAEQIKKSPVFSSLIKADVTTNGGGSLNGGDANSVKHKSLSEMDADEEIRFAKENPDIYSQMINK